MKIDGTTKLYGIIGNPVNHSLSPAMHNAAFAHLAMNCVYLPFAVSRIEEALQGIRHLAIKGASVTIPHKEAVLDFLDTVDPVAANIGAVNTITTEQKGDDILLHGFNTDWIGANRALSEKMELHGARVVVLGAGGSARAIGFGLLQAGAAITLCSRTESSGRRLAEALQCNWYPLDHADSLEGDALVNATSVGMGEMQPQSPVTAETSRGFKVVMDIVYAPLTTRLLKEAEQAGCHTINGLEMLLYQGVAQFELWAARQAPIDIMRKALFEAVGKTSPGKKG